MFHDTSRKQTFRWSENVAVHLLRRLVRLGSLFLVMAPKLGATSGSPEPVSIESFTILVLSLDLSPGSH